MTRQKESVETHGSLRSDRQKNQEILWQRPGAEQVSDVWVDSKGLGTEH